MAVPVTIGTTSPHTRNLLLCEPQVRDNLGALITRFQQLRLDGGALHLCRLGRGHCRPLAVKSVVQCGWQFGAPRSAGRLAAVRCLAFRMRAPRSRLYSICE